MARAFVVVDIQRDYFPGGAFPLVGPDEAAQNASRALAHARAVGDVVVHVQHLSADADAGFFLPGTPGLAIDGRVAPSEGETVLTKHAPNSFVGTGLEDVLRGAGVGELVVAGMMSSMCVDATVRHAVDLGFDVTVLHDACAAPDLEFAGVVVPAAQVHAAFMAALADAYADVTATADWVG